MQTSSMLFERLKVSNDSLARPAVFFLVLLLNACSPIFADLPTVTDPKLERYITAIGLEIVAVSEHRAQSASYQFRLADFSRRDILGFSTGNQTIFISYELSRLAYEDDYHRWLLRQTLAHEIAHDVLGGDSATGQDFGYKSPGLANRITSRDLGLSALIKFRPYSRSAELAADRKGMEYWHKLGWDCGNWVSLFVNFTAQGYEGDADHPTKERLDQAIQICSEQQVLHRSGLGIDQRTATDGQTPAWLSSGR
jgi:predicted Zn-dependent protease